jgi:hypothetical protein
VFLIISHFVSFFLSFSIIFSHRAYYGYYAYFFRIFKKKNNNNMEVEDTGEAKDSLSDKRLPSRPAPFLEGVQVCRCAGVRKCSARAFLGRCAGVQVCRCPEMFMPGGSEKLRLSQIRKYFQTLFLGGFPRRLSRRCAGVQVCRREKDQPEHQTGAHPTR